MILRPFVELVNFTAERMRRRRLRGDAMVVNSLGDYQLRLFASSYGQHMLRQELQRRKKCRRGKVS